MNICSPPICVEKGEQNILSQLPIFCTLQRKIGDYSRRQDILIVTIANKPHLGLAALPDIQINFCSFLIFPETWAVLRGWSRGRKWEHKWTRNVNKLSSVEKSVSRQLYPENCIPENCIPTIVSWNTVSQSWENCLPENCLLENCLPRCYDGKLSPGKLSPSKLCPHYKGSSNFPPTK